MPIRLNSLSLSITDFRRLATRSTYLGATLFAALVFASVGSAHAEKAAPGSSTNPVKRPNTSHQHCLDNLDAAVAIASNESDSSEFLLQHFAQLERECSHLPHLAHNQGVVAGKAGRWPEAIAHFERSLKLDSRAAMTHRHLQQIFEHRAAQAYANALNIASTASLPELHFQRSTNQNATAIAATSHRGELHSIGTIEYELYAWWQALQNSIGLSEHYIDDFPAAAIRLSQDKFSRQEWSDMHREITFTAKDAVAVVSDPFHNRTLLLLRLIGNRWKIYQETAL